MAYASTDDLLSLLRSSLPDWPLSSRGKVWSVYEEGDYVFEFDHARRRPQADAISFEYVQANRGYHHWVLADVDHADAYQRAFNAPLPPNIVVADRATGKAHVAWLLDHPVWVDPAGYPGWKPKPVWVLDQVTKALAASVGGDRAFAGSLTKNPLHSRWEVTVLHHDPLPAFGEIAKLLDLRAVSTGNKTRAELGDEFIGRNDAIFRAVGKAARASKHLFSHYDPFAGFCFDEATRLNDEEFGHDPLPTKEVDEIAHSVAKGTWYRWNGKAETKNRGAAQVDGSLEKSERQRAGQLFSAGVKADKSISKIKAALADMIERGMKVTQRKLAEIAGVCRNTIQTYWKDITGRTGRFINEHIVKPVRSLAARVVGALVGRKKSGFPEALKQALPNAHSPAPGPTPAKPPVQAPQWIDLDEMFEQMARQADEEQRQKIIEKMNLVQAKRQERARKPKVPFIQRQHDPATGEDTVSVLGVSFRVPSWKTSTGAIVNMAKEIKRRRQENTQACYDRWMADQGYIRTAEGWRQAA